MAERVYAQRKEGFRGAWSALYEPELRGGLYVEGYVVILQDALAFEHSWIELEEGIVDPTLWDRDLAYFPGPRFDREQALREVGEDSNLPVVWCYGWGGSDCPEYRAAYEAAWEFARKLEEDSADA